MRVSNSIQITLVACLATWHPWSGHALRHGGPSPPSEFIVQPSNVTVPEGERVVLKCMTSEQAHVCRWYYLELGLHFFDERITPVLVKDFSPAHQRDCSIKIKQVRKVQEGQWLCQALKFHSSKFLMSKPATLRVITEAESATWSPPVTEPISPRHGRREHEKSEPVEFEGTDEDQIQNTPVGEPKVLKCQVNQPITFCSWIMPHGAVLSKSQEDDNQNRSKHFTGDYRIEGDFKEGNCSLALQEVKPHDEGNWRCVVRVRPSGEDVNGPLIHLHMTEHHLPKQGGTALVDPEDDSLNLLVISLVIICSFLSIIVVLLFMCLYRRVKNSSEETRKILQISPRSSMEFQHKTLPVTELTSDSVMAVEPRKKRPLNYVDLQDYSQYLDMSKGSASDGGYIRMSGSSLRSSTSSRTTLSTLSTLPVGRSRSASNSTTLSDGSPHLGTVVDNPSYNADAVLAGRGVGIPRPASVYSNDHVYEEIKEKKEEVPAMGKIEEASPAVTPTYTNTSEDYQGYMIPKKSPSSEPLPCVPAMLPKGKPPLPDLPALHSHLLPPRDAADEAAPSYSRVGEGSSFPSGVGAPTPSPLGPGYSRVGTATQDPMEAYDTPRPIPTAVLAADPLEGYDTPRRTGSEASLQPLPVLSPEVCADALVGTIV